VHKIECGHHHTVLLDEDGISLHFKIVNFLYLKKLSSKGEYLYAVSVVRAF
jgi:hypothetical protein